MKHVVIAIVGLASALGAAGLVETAGAATSARQSLSELSGSSGSSTGPQLFSRNCAVCHGADAQGKSGPRLVGTSLSLSAIQKKVSDGGTQMPSFKKKLSPDEIKAVAAYVRSLSGRS